MNLNRTGKPAKIECELKCGERNKEVLHWHHIVERTELNTDNSYWNLVVLCPTCHTKIHTGLIKIIGVYPSTNPVLARTVIWETKDNKNDFNITEPYYTPTPKSEKWHAKNNK